MEKRQREEERNGGISERSKIEAGVHQKSRLSYFVLVTLLDEVLKGKIVNAAYALLFLGDIVVVLESLDELKAMLDAITIALEKK